MKILGVTRKAGVTALGAIALLIAPLSSATARTGSAADTIDPSTRANVIKSIKGEAFAYAKYRAYAAQAEIEQLPEVQALYERTATTEFREHLTELANLIGLVGGNAANLRDTISGESYEAATMYKQFAEQARADGDSNAAELFTEIGNDEAKHSGQFAQALKAITQPSTGATIPAEAEAKSTSIPAGKPKVSSPRTLHNLQTAMQGEAYAHAKYTLYAEHARTTGQPDLGTLFDSIARIELTEHFAEEATLAGLVGDTKTNLCETISTETYEGEQMYPSYARQAAAVGDQTAAALLTDTGNDELAHARAFTDAFSALGKQCPTPS